MEPEKQNIVCKANDFMLLVVHLRLMVYYRKFDDFLHHVAMLSAFLHYPDELLEYVVVTCFRKILFRVNHNILKLYFLVVSSIVHRVRRSGPVRSFCLFGRTETLTGPPLTQNVQNRDQDRKRQRFSV